MKDNKDNLCIDIPVSYDLRQEFYDIIKNSNLSIIRESELTEEMFFATVQLSDCEDAYWLGRNYQLMLKKQI